MRSDNFTGTLMGSFIPFLLFLLPPHPHPHPYAYRTQRSHFHPRPSKGEGASPTFYLISCSRCPPSKSSRESHAFRRQPARTLSQTGAVCPLVGGVQKIVQTVSGLTLTKVWNSNVYANKKGARLNDHTSLAMALI